MLDELLPLWLLSSFALGCVARVRRGDVHRGKDAKRAVHSIRNVVRRPAKDVPVWRKGRRRRDHDPEIR